MQKVMLDNLMVRVASLTVYSVQQARLLAMEICQTGVKSRAEAEILINLNRKLTVRDKRTGKQFTEAIKSYLLTVESPVGWIAEDQAVWLASTLSRGREAALESELDLLVSVLDDLEEGCFEFNLFVLRSICAYAVKEGRINARAVQQLRCALRTVNADDAIWVTQAEASCLLKLNDALGHAKNDAGWNDLFARAVSNYLIATAHPDPDSESEALARDTWLEPRSMGVAGFFCTSATLMMNGSWFERIAEDARAALRARIITQEAAWHKIKAANDQDKVCIAGRLGFDDVGSPAERALILFLNKEAPGFTHGLVTSCHGILLETDLV